jgi:hypothetical protein
MFLDTSVERENDVSSVPAPGQTHVSDDDDEPSARNENSEDVSPDSVELGQEGLVILDIP